MRDAPFLYKYMNSKLLEYSTKRKITTWEFRRLCGVIMRIRKNDSMMILKEMEQMKLLKYDKNSEIIHIF